MNNALAKTLLLAAPLAAGVLLTTVPSQARTFAGITGRAVNPAQAPCLQPYAGMAVSGCSGTTVAYQVPILNNNGGSKNFNIPVFGTTSDARAYTLNAAGTSYWASHLASFSEKDSNGIVHVGVTVPDVFGYLYVYFHLVYGEAVSSVNF
jgi:hypothetical protein